MNDNKEKIKPLDYLAMLLSWLLRLIFVPKCVICKEILDSGSEFCPQCLKIWKSARGMRCPVCRKTARACKCRPIALGDTDMIGERSMISLIFYGTKDDEMKQEDIAAQKLITRLKTDTDRSCVRFVARELAGDILRHFANNGGDIGDWVITYPPRCKHRRREYGFDQGRDMAMMLSEFTGMKVENCFVNVGNTVQKELNSLERQNNANASYSLKKGASPKGKNYLIVDDVITTGATVNSCAKLLRNAGAVKIFPVCVERTRKKRRKAKRRPAKRPWFTYKSK